jgi:hypothetical protein
MVLPSALPGTLHACDRRPPALDEDIDVTESVLGLTLPGDYEALLRATNGLAGFVAPTAYLVLWAVSDVPSLNEGYGVAEFLPGVTLIGTDGADTGYGFRYREGQVEYLSTPLVGMEPAALTLMGTSLEELAARIRDGR